MFPAAPEDITPVQVPFYGLGGDQGCRNRVGGKNSSWRVGWASRLFGNLFAVWTDVGLERSGRWEEAAKVTEKEWVA